MGTIASGYQFVHGRGREIKKGMNGPGRGSWVDAAGLMDTAAG